MGTTRYEWFKYDPFKIGISETKLYIKTTSTNLELKLDYTSNISAQIINMHTEKKRDDLCVYLKYIFSNIMLMNDNDYFSSIMNLINQKVNESLTKDETCESQS